MGVGSLWIGLLGSCLGLLVLGCGGESVKSGSASAAAAGSGGQSGQGVGSSGTMGGSAGAGVDPGDSAEPFCATETEIAAPTGSTGCVVSVRTVDPVFHLRQLRMCREASIRARVRVAAEESVAFRNQ